MRVYATALALDLVWLSMESDRDLFQVVFRIVYSLWYGFSKSGKKTSTPMTMLLLFSGQIWVFSFIVICMTLTRLMITSLAVKKKTIITLNYFLLLLLLPRQGRDIFFNKGKNEINDPL